MRRVAYPLLLLTACTVPPNEVLYISPVDRDGRELIPAIDVLALDLLDPTTGSNYTFTIVDGEEDEGLRTGLPDITGGILTLRAYQQQSDMGLFLDAWGRLDGVDIGPEGSSRWVLLGQQDRFNLLPASAESDAGSTLELGDSARIFAVATLLPSGKVLITGGSTTSNQGSEAVDRALLFDDGVDTGLPGTGKAGGDGGMFISRVHHTATLLEDASGSDALVALVGGDTTLRLLDDARIHRISTDLSGSEPTTSVEVYTVSSDSFTDLGESRLSHAFHSATPLTGGRLMITGGVGVVENSLELQPGIEILTLSTSLSSSSDLGTLSTPRLYHNAGAFTRGGTEWVWVAGGIQVIPTTDLELTPDLLLANTELIDPDKSKGEATLPGPDLHEARAGAALVALEDGRLLVVGGTGKRTTSEGEEILTPLDTLEVFDPADGAVGSVSRVIGHLGYPRSFHTLVPLGGDRFMVVGGQGRQTSHLPPEIITLTDVSSGLSVEARPLGEEPFARLVGEAVAPLPEGKVLLIGGYSPSSSAWNEQPGSRLVYFPPLE